MPKTNVPGESPLPGGWLSSSRSRFLQLLVGVLALAAGPGLIVRTAASDAVSMIFLGDSGTGGRRQLEVRSEIVKVAERTPLEYAVLLGDNIYGGNKGKSFGSKFLDVYAPLFSRGVEFHAALGNHDVEDCQVVSGDSLPRTDDAYVESGKCWAREQIQAREFGYNNGYRYYSFASPGDPPLVETFVLDSNTLRGDGGDDEGGALGASSDAAQLEWLKQALADSNATWKILAMHHPIHSPKGRRILGLGHKPDPELGEALESVIIGKIDVVFQGHNHLYARMLPREGVRYFVSGGGGQRPYRFNPDADTVARDEDRGGFNHFVYTRITRDEFQYCVIDKDGVKRDGGWFRKGDAADTPFPAGECPPLGDPADSGDLRPGS